ncbi:hypothetical protein AJ78_00256 [Emergomyces pasteurianus Ep9510]|uniref:Rhodopsin domain-containing protein n=1 Tax=Emergomyces pasteurianus Ep9510 TaxID=1447872 RepID=A0A1J9QWS4_9EURO|nr:hypothetical protein AJ78_00256 [Emergomyces pasteurianus Ep9510]
MEISNGEKHIHLSEASEDRGHTAFAVGITVTSLAAFFVAARFYTRRVLVKKLGADDWTCLVSLIFSFAFMGLFTGVEWKSALGGDRSELSPEMFRKQVILLWASVPMYNISLFCTKASISLQYRRIFPGSRIRIVCNGAIVFIVLYGMWVVLGSFLICIPVQKFWDDTVEGSCMSRDGLWLSTAIVHIVTDIILLMMPMPILVRLNLPRRQRIALVLVFALGGFVCVTSGLRLKSLRQVARADDIVRDNAAAATWSAIECNVAIVCCSLPTLRPLVARIFPHIFSSSTCDYGRQYKQKIPCLSRWFAGQDSREAIDREHGIKSYQKRQRDEEQGGYSAVEVDGITGSGSISQEESPTDNINRGRPPS